MFSKSKIETTSQWVSFFRANWQMELPMAIHSRGVDDGHGLGSPPYHPEFERWLGPICFCGRKPDPNVLNDRGCPSSNIPRGNKKDHNSDARLRTTKAFRKLRKVAPREFDALYLMCALSASFETAMQSLNERAERLDKPERYGPNEMVLLVVSGIDKLVWYW